MEEILVANFTIGTKDFPHWVVSSLKCDLLHGNSQARNIKVDILSWWLSQLSTYLLVYTSVFSYIAKGHKMCNGWI